MTYTLEGAQREQNETLTALLRSSAVAQLTIYALLAIPLRSYVQPLLIMSVIPFGFVGAVIGHLLMGRNLSILSFMGVITASVGPYALIRRAAPSAASMRARFSRGSASPPTTPRRSGKRSPRCSACSASSRR